MTARVPAAYASRFAAFFAACLVAFASADVAAGHSTGHTLYTSSTNGIGTSCSGCHGSTPAMPRGNAADRRQVIEAARNNVTDMASLNYNTIQLDAIAAYLETVFNTTPISRAATFQAATPHSLNAFVNLGTSATNLTTLVTSTAPTKGAVTYNSAAGAESFTYTGGACQTGADTFSYYARNAADSLRTSTRTVNITIQNPATGPTISTGATLPAGQTSVFYSTSLAATCPSLVSFSHVAGTLPPGLSVSAGGTISGTPTSLAASPYSFTIRATYVGSAFTDKVFTISISVGPPNITSGTTAAAGSVGVVYSGYTIAATNSPTSFGATGLPPGLVVNPATGVISGTPTSAAGSPYTVNVTATNANTTDNQNVTFNIVPEINSAATANGQTGVPFTYAITEAAGPAFTTHAALDPLPAGLTLTAATGVISGTPTVVGGPTNVRLTGSTAFGTSAQFTLAITIGLGPPVITSAATAANSSVGVAFSGYTIAATNSPTTFGASNLPPGLTVSPTTGAIAGTPTSAAGSPYTATVTASNGVPPNASQNVTFNVVPAINSAATASGQTGVAFNYQITPAPGPVFTSFAALDPLPAGLTLNTGTGAITGIPTALGGPTNVRLTGSNAFGTSAQFTLAITITLGPPVITSPLTASGGVTIPFNYQIAASNPPHSAFNATPLPTGLTVNATGLISGVPVPGAGGTYNVSISATNATNTGSATLVLTISENPPVITSPLTASGTTGVAFSYTITANNGTTGFSATGLPPGLVVNAASGVISGTPTNPGTFNVSITATNGSGSDTETLVLTIALGPPMITSPTTAANSSVGVAYSGYTITAASLPTSFGASNLPPGLVVNPTTGAITGTPTSAAGSPYNATVTASNGVPPNASQNVTFNVVPGIASAATASGQTTVPFSYQITSAPGPVFTSYASLDPLPAGLTLNTATGAITGIPTVIGGPTSVRLTGSNAFGTSAQFTLAITIAVGPPVITSTAAAGGNEGFPFSYQITATNSPTSFGATGLPPGLSVSTTTGVISGTPTVSGTFNATISATNATATATQPLVITLGVGIPVFTSAATASGGTGRAFVHQLVATNNPTSFGASGLPPGLSINPATGLITGRPAVAGRFSVNVSATNPAGTGSRALAIDITLRTPVVPGPGITITGVAGEPFSYAIREPAGPVTGFTATGLPPGLTLDGATGMITGTPTAGGTYQVTIGVTNAAGTSTFTLTIIIDFQLPTVAAATVDVPYETATPITLPVTGEMVTIAIVTLPEHGLVNVVGGVATYTPAIGYTGPDAFSYTATNPAGTTAAATVSITVIPLPPSARAALMTVPLNSATTFSLAPFIKGAGLTGVAIRTQPNRGTVTVNGLEVTYTPRTDFFGTDSFTYVAFGTLGSSAPATVSVEVVGRPDPTRDPTVTAMVEAQNQAARRFAGTQIGNIHRRMESLHRTEPDEPAPAAPASSPAAPVAAAERVRLASAAGAQPEPVRDVAPLSLVTTIAQAVTSRTLDLNGGTGRADRATSFWIAGNAWFGNLDATGERTGSTFGTDGVSFGADRRFGERASAGLAAGFARDEVKIGTEGSRSKARGASIAGYGSYQAGPHTYIDALLGFGTLRFDSDRYVVPVEEFAHGERKGRQVFGSIAGAYEHRVGNLLVSPYARFDFSADRLGEVVESGAGAYALRYAEHDQRTSQAALGVRAESKHETEFGFAQPRARAEYRREFGGTRRAIVSYADLLGGDEYSIAPAGTSRNSLMLGVGVDLVFRGGLKLGIDYNAQRASGASNTQGIRLMVTQDLDARGASPWRFEPLLYKYPINVDFGYGYDDNVNRGRDPAEKRWDNVFSMGANVSRAWPIGKNMRLQVTGLASGEKFDRHAGLGRFSAGGQAEVQYRTSGAFDATTLALSGRALYEQYESHHRTGPRYFIGFNARRALTDRIELFAELGANVRHGNSDVFNWRDYAAKLNLDYSLGRKGILYLSGEYRRGDTASSGFASLVNVGAADVFVPDDAFEGLDYFAYRFDARTVMGTIGINHPLGARDSIDLSWRRVQSTPRKRPAWDSPGSLRYIDNQYSLVYLMRF